MKRMTPQYPIKSQKNSPADAVFPNCFIGIGGTTGNIPATGRQIGRNSFLIEPD
jgi:hypothetical protein